MSKKKTDEIIKEYTIDYDMFSLEEVVKIISFFKTIENINKNKKYKKDAVIEKYNEYRSILNNKSLEKQYDKMLEKRSNVSIYQTMKMVMEN